MATKMQNTTLGNVIFSIRKDQNLNQVELCKKIGITQTALSLIETGNMKPSLKTLQKICTALNINKIQLLELVIGSNNKDEMIEYIFEHLK